MVDPRIPYFYKTFYRVPFLVPYWSADEWKLVTSTLFSQTKQQISGAKDLEAALYSRGFGHVVLTSTGRLAIELALRSLNSPGAEVIVPTFCCSAVAQAVLASGCIPIFADINPDLTLSATSVERLITAKTAAVLVAHLSGKPAADLEKIVSICRDRKVVLIDDAAQACGVKYKGQPLGTFGKFGILSFGVGKPTFSLGGGALVLGSPVEKARAESLLENLSGRRSPGSESLHAVNFLLQYQWRRSTFPFFSAGRGIAKIFRRHSRMTPRGPITELEARLQVLQLEKLDDILQAFRRNGARVLSALGSDSRLSAPQHAPDTAYTKLLLRVPGAAKQFATHLLKNSVEVEWTYRPLDTREPYKSYRRLTPTYAHDAWQDLVAVPDHATLTPAQVEHVASTVATFRLS